MQTFKLLTASASVTIVSDTVLTNSTVETRLQTTRNDNITKFTGVPFAAVAPEAVVVVRVVANGVIFTRRNSARQRYFTQSSRVIAFAGTTETVKEG
jgi:hypothetical protein